MEYKKLLKKVKIINTLISVKLGLLIWFSLISMSAMYTQSTMNQRG